MTNKRFGGRMKSLRRYYFAFILITCNRPFAGTCGRWQLRWRRKRRGRSRGPEPCHPANGHPVLHVVVRHHLFHVSHSRGTAERCQLSRTSRSELSFFLFFSHHHWLHYKAAICSAHVCSAWLGDKWTLNALNVWWWCHVSLVWLTRHL